MWRALIQLPKRALGMGVHLWGLFLHLLSQGLWAPLLCLLMLLQVLCIHTQKGGRVVFTIAYSVAVRAQVFSIYIFLQGVTWFAQLARSCVALPIQLCGAVLETLTCTPLIWLCEQASRRLVQASIWAGRSLAEVWGMATFVQLWAQMLFLGLCVCMHMFFAIISSKVCVRVREPFRFSLPIRVRIPLDLGMRVRLQGRSPGKVEQEVGTPQVECGKEQKLQTSRILKSMRREVSPRRRELSPVVPSAATLIIVVCVGFLVLMVILGLVRIHSLHRRVSGSGGSPGVSSDPKDPDLFWDDSALTIIVNPMESYQNRQACVAGVAGGQQEDEDSSDSEAADSPSSDERRIIESPPHRY